MSKYTPEQTSRMVIDPNTEGDIHEAYPHLDVIEWGETPAEIRDKFIRYLAWCYDPESPLVKKQPEMKARKLLAAQYTGYDGVWLYKQAAQFLIRILKNKDWAYIQ